jgi:hypothetical protein
MRGSQHDTNFRIYNLTPTGAVLGEALDDRHGITTGVPTLTRARQTPQAGLTTGEANLLDVLTRLKNASSEQLAKQTGLPAKTVQAGIARLIMLGFVDGNGKDGDEYRALARPSGA